MLRIFALIAAACVVGARAALNEWEALYVQQPNPGRIFEHLTFYTSRPHIAGTETDYDTALYTEAGLRRFGVDVRIEPLNVTLSYPLTRSLRLLAPTIYEAGLTEAILPEDPTSSDPRHIMTYNGYSASADVTGPLVYANYGREEDYLELDRLGVSLAGRIVIARYGAIFRGNKAYFAEERGAIGLIIYSDPADDGFVRGDVYPDGPWRPATAVQRGTCAYIAVCPGDPGKPERCGDVDRILPTIPILPVSYADAEPFLRALGGDNVPAGWQGGLPFTYKIGPGSAVVNLNVSMETGPRTIWNVVGEIPGSKYPNRRVVIGNHRDAWTPGGVDPNSGTSVMLELARSLAVLVEAGWRPERTIQFGSWDGEEFDLIGSVEFGEGREAELKDEAVAYLNVDAPGKGSTLIAGASPSLNDFLRDGFRDILDPKSGLPLYDVWSKQISILGSGSDYTVFLARLGVASTDIAWDGPSGVYHSIYDSLTWVQRFGDPTFEYHTAMAQLWGLLTLRMADAPVLPFNYVELATGFTTYLADTEALLVSNGGAGQVDLADVAAAISEFAATAALAAQERARCAMEPSPCPVAELEALNDHLAFTERRFLDDGGLPKRPWFKNQVFAPGFRTGYAGNAFPALVDAINDRNWPQTTQQAAVLAGVIRSAAAYLAEIVA